MKSIIQNITLRGNKDFCAEVQHTKHYLNTRQGSSPWSLPYKIFENILFNRKYSDNRS